VSSRGRGYGVPVWCVFLAATIQLRFTWLPSFNRAVMVVLSLLYALVEIEDIRFSRRCKVEPSPPSPRYPFFAWFQDDVTPGWWRNQAIWWVTWMTPMIPNTYVCALGLMAGVGVLAARYRLWRRSPAAHES
jgi:hypothetical protein